MRISDWSSDVCSSDLAPVHGESSPQGPADTAQSAVRIHAAQRPHVTFATGNHTVACTDRKSVVEGKSVSVRVDLGGRRIIKKKKTKHSSNRHKDIRKQHMTSTKQTKE